MNLDLFVKLDGDRGANRNGMLALQRKTATISERLGRGAGAVVVAGSGRPYGGLEIQYGQDGRRVAGEACYW